MEIGITIAPLGPKQSPVELGFPAGVRRIPLVYTCVYTIIVRPSAALDNLINVPLGCRV